jgi:hypothetical protein
MHRLLLVLFLLSMPIPSFAYIGPGMGGGIVVAFLGFFAAILLGIWAILYYPIKRALKNRRNQKAQVKESDP